MSIIVSGLDEYMQKLETLERRTDKIVKGAIGEAVSVLLEEIERGIDAIPSEPWKPLAKDEIFTGISDSQHEDLKKGLKGIKMRPKNFAWVGGVAFVGYGKPIGFTNKYKKGIPNALLARSIESGSSVRAKIPFFRMALKRAESRAKQAMNDRILAVIAETGK